MKIVCIGDSLTEGDYGVFGKSGIADVRSKNYPFFLAQSAKAAVINHGHYGYAPQVEKAVEFVRAFAKEKQLPLIDVAACTEFSAEAESVMQPNDGLHFSEIGYRTLAAFIEQNLRRLFAEKF